MDVLRTLVILEFTVEMTHRRTAVSYILFADGHGGVGHVQSDRGPVLSVGGADQTVDGSIENVHA